MAVTTARVGCRPICQMEGDVAAGVSQVGMGASRWVAKVEGGYRGGGAGEGGGGRWYGEG